MLSLEKTENEVLTITSEPPSSEDNFETKLQSKFAASDQSYKNKDSN